MPEKKRAGDLKKVTLTTPQLNIKPQNAYPPLQTQGEHHANKKSGQTLRHRRSVANSRKPGRPRKPRKRGGALSMGRYPFQALLNDYLAKRRVTWSEVTYKERERKYRYLCRVFRDLKKQGRTDTMNPEKFTEKEVLAFEGWMRDRNLDPATKLKYRGYIKDFLSWNENYVYERLIRRECITTQLPVKEIKTISYEDFQGLLNYTHQNRETWLDNVTYFMIAMYGYLGLRNKELRLEIIEDLDIEHWTYTVSHPKGEGRYGKKRTLPIVQPLRPIIKEYLTVRDKYLRENGFINVKPLIPSITKRDGKATITYYTSQRLSDFARKISKATGIEFQIKTLRASSGQFLKDMGANIEVVSKFLGHSSTKTTERFYARLRDEAMFQEVNTLFSRMGNSTISPLIKNKNQMSGYA